MIGSTRGLISDITQFLLPLMQTPDERDLWLTQAFYYTESRIYHQIDRTGTPLMFINRCIRFLWDFGCFSDKTHPLSILLDAVKMGSSVDKQNQINSWILQLNGRCAEPVPFVPLTAMLDVPSTRPVSPVTPLQTIATPIAERTPTVFISYSRKDDAIAKRLISDLNAVGHACWFDQTSIKSDEPWSKAISAGINNSYAFVTLVSTVANASKWVLREYLIADRKTPPLPIFVMQLEDCDLPDEMIERQV